MWSTDTIWFEISVITGLTSFGQIYFGHFEKHTPKWRRALKILLFIGIAITLTTTLGRAWTLGFLALCLVAVLIIHTVVLPAKGINGWTAEPKEKYYQLRGWDKHLRDN